MNIFSQSSDRTKSVTGSSWGRWRIAECEEVGCSRVSSLAKLRGKECGGVRKVPEPAHGGSVAESLGVTVRRTRKTGSGAFGGLNVNNLLVHL